MMRIKKLMTLGITLSICLFVINGLQGMDKIPGGTFLRRLATRAMQNLGVCEKVLSQEEIDEIYSWTGDRSCKKLPKILPVGLMADFDAHSFCYSWKYDKQTYSGIKDKLSKTIEQNHAMAGRFVKDMIERLEKLEKYTTNYVLNEHASNLIEGARESILVSLTFIFRSCRFDISNISQYVVNLLDYNRAGENPLKDFFNTLNDDELKYLAIHVHYSDLICRSILESCILPLFKGKRKIVERMLLLDGGHYSYDAKDIITDYYMRNGEDSLVQVVASDNLPSVVRKIILNPSTVNEVGIFGITPLMTAIQYNKEDIAQYLINKCSNLDLTASDDKGDTALHYAINAGNRSLIEALLSKGASYDHKNKAGKTAVDLAREKGVLTKKFRVQRFDTEKTMLFSKEVFFDREVDSTEKQDERDTRCSICLETYKPGESVVVTQCGHIFKEACFNTLINTGRTLVCSVCRSPLKKEDAILVRVEGAPAQAEVKVESFVTVKQEPLDDTDEKPSKKSRKE